MKSFFSKLRGKLRKQENARAELAYANQELQAIVTKIQQAAAQSIATEKQLEWQHTHCTDQVETWRGRAESAKKHHDDEHADQASKKQAEYEQAAADMKSRWQEQAAITATTVQRWREFETVVERLHVPSHLLMALDVPAQHFPKLVASQQLATSIYRQLLDSEMREKITSAVYEQSGGYLSLIEQLQSRLDQLERDTVCAYEDVITEGIPTESAVDLSKMLSEISKMKEILETKASKDRENLTAWTKREELAEQTGRPELAEAARQRKDRSARSALRLENSLHLLDRIAAVVGAIGPGSADDPTQAE